MFLCYLSIILIRLKRKATYRICSKRCFLLWLFTSTMFWYRLAFQNIELLILPTPTLIRLLHLSFQLRSILCSNLLPTVLRQYSWLNLPSKKSDGITVSHTNAGLYYNFHFISFKKPKKSLKLAWFSHKNNHSTVNRFYFWKFFHLAYGVIQRPYWKWTAVFITAVIKRHGLHTVPLYHV